MSFKEFSILYRRNEDCYINSLYSSIGLYNLMIKLGDKITDEEEPYINFTEKFLKDFYSIEDTNVTALKEFNKVTELDRIYNKVLSL